MTAEYFEQLCVISAKAAVLLAAAGALQAALGRASASARHFVWATAVCGALALPPLAVALPAWRVAALAPVAVFEPGRRDADARGVRAAGAVAEPAARVVGVASVVVPSAGPAPATDPAALVSRPAASPASPTAPFASWQAWALAVWLAGALACAGRIAGGWAVMRRISSEAEPAGGESAAEVARLSARLGVRRPVRLLVSRRLAVPVATGVVRPAVLLPEEARSWDAGRREVVLLHELAHVKRWDCATQMLARLACALYWFVPLVWVAARRMRLERERAADDCVLASGVRASEYADHLVEIARAVRGGRRELSRAAAVAIASRSQLEERVRAILDGRRAREPRRAVALAVVALAAGALGPLAAARPFAAPDAAPRPALTAPGGAHAAAPHWAAPAAGAPLSAATDGALLPDSPQPTERATAPKGDPAGADLPAGAGSPAGTRQERDAPAGSRGDVVAALEAALDDEDENVRRQAAWALRMIRMRSGEGLDVEPPDVDVDPHVVVPEVVVPEIENDENGEDPDAPPSRSARPAPHPTPRPAPAEAARSRIRGGEPR